ncbi:hypothetical protein SAMN02745150_00293 [Brevinema andersonii]|uniref:FecR family protein n=1 Tax=Brevinema andersonii TaxID=34097 RepID=A0A1I1D4F7_BREAD|nr:hypothetical protein [Brevinema andersonii]SFB69684.1 hypothetical protein SAMN02745150_00293 [Brevinema andersonii]
MKRIFYYFASFLIISPCLWSKNPVSQILVRDAVGDVQYRAIVAPSWTPITAGVRLQERTLIRLNTPDSIATFSLPDGSLLRLIGIGSVFLDYIVRPVNNTYQTKMLLMTGRWFYSSNPNSKTRMIVNTDVTTSIIENGSGGGYFFNGTNELLIRSGHGVIGYRQHDSIPVSLDENQVISFNIYDGFFRVPELATDAHYQNYLIFSEDTKNFMKPEDLTFSPAQPLSSAQKDNQDTQVFLFYPDKKMFESISKNVPKPPLFSGDINFEQLKVLEDLSFVKREDPLRVVIAKLRPPPLPPLPEPKPISNTKRVIPLSLLKPINLEDFEVPKPQILTQAQKQPAEPLQLVKPRPRPKRSVPVRPLTPIVSQEQKTNIPEIIDLEAIKVEQIPIVEEVNDEPKIVIPQAHPRRPVIVPKPVEEKKEIFTVPQSFTNEFDPNAKEFQYRSFEVRELEDLLQGDFSSTIFY